MTPEELRSLQPGDRIRHMTSGHTLRCTTTAILNEKPTSIWVERNFRINLEPIYAWHIVSQPRLGPMDRRVVWPFA